MSSPSPDRLVADLARRQHGTFNRSQARHAGLSDRQIDRRIASDQWLRLAPSVFALPGNPGTWQRQLMAAILGEPVAAGSDRSAAVMFDVHGVRPGRPEIVVPSNAGHRSRLAIVHRRDDVRSTIIDGIPVTTVEQTVVDLARTMGVTRLTEVVEDVTSRHLTTIAKIAARHQQLARATRPGIARLEQVLVARSTSQWVPAASVLEQATYALLDELGLPYVRQPSFPWRPLDPERLDAFLPRSRLFLEADGRRWHERVAQSIRDRRRDHEVLAHGHRLLRLGWEEIIEEPTYAKQTILAIASHVRAVGATHQISA